MIAAREQHAYLSQTQIARIEKALIFLGNLETKFDQNALENDARWKQKITKGMIDISNISTEILSNPGAKDHVNGTR